MKLRELREQKFISQERLSEMSGLSLRTIQRLEAGHRVSYASLRALAVTLEIDVDAFERQLYAARSSDEDFVELPRWVRLIDGRRWFGGPGLSRLDAHVVEAFCLVCALFVFALSFAAASAGAAKVLGRCAFVTLGCCYLVCMSIRLADRYRLWPDGAGATSSRARTWRHRTAEYACLLGLGVLGTAVLYWLAF